MNGKKHVFKIVPGKELSRNHSKVLYWSELDYQPGFVRRVKLIPQSKEDEDKVLELSVRFCGNYTGSPLVFCVDEEEKEKNVLKYTYYNKNTPGYSSNSHAFVYYGNILTRLSMKSELVDMTSTVGTYGWQSTVSSEEVQHKYLTLEESDTGSNKYYFSDNKGNMIDSPNNVELQDLMLCDENKAIENILSSISENIVLSIMFPKVFPQTLTEKQLKALISTFNDNQIQALAENLTDNQFRALVDHLTDHQLHTLAQELNPEKLQIIVPILNDAQLEALVRDLNPEQVKEILPHLKVDQFKALIKTLNDEQFTVLAKDLAEHHLTILSKELEGDQLKALVNSLQEEQLKDLVNKLDHEKLEAIAQDLTDPNRIQTIIKSLADNPGKLQAFARNLSNEQFKALLDNIDANELKDIIHKLPYEKVTVVIGDLSNQDQSKAIIDALKGKLEEQNEKLKEVYEKLEEQNEKLKEVYEKLEELLPPPVYSEALESLRSSPRISQDTNIEFIAVEEYAYHESEYL